jgi:hypothetical protein
MVLVKKCDLVNSIFDIQYHMKVTKSILHLFLNLVCKVFSYQRSTFKMCFIISMISRDAHMNVNQPLYFCVNIILSYEAIFVAPCL